MKAQEFIKKKGGFTLIELLIVVAIIAILAAIAVPNFLEAQVRAKVSRVHSDMRSMVVGLESYHVDYNSYPGYWERPGFKREPAAGTVLSTPIAYLTNAQMIDPFKAGSSGSNDTGRPDQLYLNYYTGRRDTREQAWSNGAKNCYALQSFGPDRVDNTNMGGYPFTRNTTNGQWIGQYDATNGTKSQGEISRGMPRLPRTWVFDVPTTPNGQDPFAY